MSRTSEPHQYISVHDLVCLIDDNNSMSLLSPLVLTIARLRNADMALGQLRLECVEPSCQNHGTLTTDITMVEPMPFIPGTLLKVFGEKSLTDDRNLLLKAKIIKVVDGLDIKHFNKAQQVRSEYLSQRALHRKTVTESE